jgi:hypothetical protein
MYKTNDVYLVSGIKSKSFAYPKYGINSLLYSRAYSRADKSQQSGPSNCVGVDGLGSDATSVCHEHDGWMAVGRCNFPCLSELSSQLFDGHIGVLCECHIMKRLLLPSLRSDLQSRMVVIASLSPIWSPSSMSYNIVAF